MHFIGILLTGQLCLSQVRRETTEGSRRNRIDWNSIIVCYRVPTQKTIPATSDTHHSLDWYGASIHRCWFHSGKLHLQSYLLPLTMPISIFIIIALLQHKFCVCFNYADKTDRSGYSANSLNACFPARCRYYVEPSSTTCFSWLAPFWWKWNEFSTYFGWR